MGWFAVRVAFKFRYIQPCIWLNVSVTPQGTLTVFFRALTFKRARAWHPRQVSCWETQV